MAWNELFQLKFENYVRGPLMMLLSVKGNTVFYHLDKSSILNVLL
jgi:hypothetical protein